MKPIFTCITATFNVVKSGNRERLIRCIESVAKLNSPHEHLIYDGASQDGTVELLHELESQTPGLKVVSEPDRGIYNALNKGIRDAAGRMFAVLGCDDYYSNPKCLDSILQSLTDDVKMVMSRVDSSNGYRFMTKRDDVKTIFCGIPFAHMGMLIDSNMARHFGGFDENLKMGADQDLFFKMLSSGCCFKVCYDQFAIYTPGGASADNPEICRGDILKVYQKYLKLTDNQIEDFDRKGFYSPIVMIPLLVHHNWIYRLGARYMLWKAFRYYLRIALFPIVYIRKAMK